jgi:hypothetical protein
MVALPLLTTTETVAVEDAIWQVNRSYVATDKEGPKGREGGKNRDGGFEDGGDCFHEYFPCGYRLANILAALRPAKFFANGANASAGSA